MDTDVCTRPPPKTHTHTHGERERERERETAECSHPCKDSQQRLAFQVVFSLKLQIAASCCKIVAHL